MAKLLNHQWQTRAAIALVVATALAGCGTRDDLANGGNGGNGGGTGGNANNSTDTFAITSMNRLVTFNRNSPTARNAVNITGLASGETILGFDIRPSDSSIVALVNSGRLYRISSSDGTATLIATLSRDNNDTTNPFTALDGASFGVNFNPVPDRLRVVSNTGQNLRINVANGATTTDGTLNVTNVTATTYTNSFPSACRTLLYYINTTTNQLLNTTDPNSGVLNPVANLNIGTGNSITGFEVVTGSDGTNTALIVVSGTGTSTLMTLNLTNGTLTNSQAIAGLNSGESIMAISMAPPNGTPTQALGDLVAVTQSNRLISFNAAAPQKLCTPATPIANLQSGDNILGIDVRPRDRLLYALGSSGRLYTINTVAGTSFASATVGPMLQAASGSSFNGLSGNDFGFDFNPMTDRLRVVSNNGQNLSIDVDAGTATTQTALNPGAPGVTAAAYTNSVLNTTSTTLYVIDTSNETLSTQGVPTTTPANGTLTLVGNLNTGDVTGTNGFDIRGSDNLAVAAFTLASSNSGSDLFTINLGSGLATRVAPVSTIGGGERIRGLAFAAAPAAMLMAVTADNQLITFDPTAPGTLVDAVNMEGLQGGEAVVSMQVQSDGKLQITTDGQRSYAVNATTGEATLVTSEVAARTSVSATAGGIRFSAMASTGSGLSFGAALTGLGQSRLFKLDANGQPTAVGMIGPSGTAAVRAMGIRLN